MANEAFQVALGHHRAGRLREAELAYREILEKQPRNVDALHMLGVLASQVGRNDIAVQLLKEAIAIMPASGVMHAELGEFQRRLGNLEEAEASCRTAVSLEPALAEAHFNLGVVLQERKKLESAIASYRAALVINPANPPALYNLGNAQRDSGQINEAITAYRAALALHPGYAEAEGNLGLALHKIGELDAAAACFNRVLAARPGDLVALNSLGNVLRDQNHRDAAAGCYAKALELKPTDAAALTHFGKLLHEEGKFEQAAEYHRKAIAADPERAEAYQNLAMACEKLGLREEALGMYHEALARCVNSPVARFYMAAMTGRDAPPLAPPEHLIESFDSLAATFDQHLVDNLKYRGHSLVFDAARGAAAGNSFGSLIDLGCGTGLCGTLFRAHCKKLTGIDIAPRMIDQARSRKIYDELLIGEIVDLLRSRTGAFDTIIAADVLIYFGQLEPLFAVVAGALVAGGLFAFTVEAFSGESGHHLLKTGRYAHSADYLRSAAASHGFAEVSLEQAVLRQENRKDVAGLVMVLRRTPRDISTARP